MGVEIEALKIMIDNQSAIMLSKTSAHHNRSKHTGACYHFIRDYCKDERVMIEHVKTKDQLAYFLTKALGTLKFGELSVRIRVKEVWAERKMEEIVRGDFPLRCTAGVRCTAVACSGVQRHAGASTTE